jgi:hypothetical protein
MFDWFGFALWCIGVSVPHWAAHLPAIGQA